MPETLEDTAIDHTDPAITRAKEIVDITEDPVNPEQGAVSGNYQAIVSKDELVDELEHRGALSELVQQALTQAESSHGKQIRRDGTPYLDGHVFPIAFDLALSLDSGDPDYEAIITTAILHDTVEDDPDFPPERLAADFPAGTTRSVMLLTNHPSGHEPHFTADSQKLDFNRRYINSIHESGDRVAIIVKLADRLNNTNSAAHDPSLVPTGPDDPQLAAKAEKQLRKLQEVEELFLPMAKDTSPEYYARLLAACTQLRQMQQDAQRMQNKVFA